MKLTITDGCMKRSAHVEVLLGRKIHIFKKPCSPRCLAEYPDTEEVRQFIEAYEAGKILPVSHKAVMVAYGRIMAECKDLKMGAL